MIQFYFYNIWIGLLICATQFDLIWDLVKVIKIDLILNLKSLFVTTNHSQIVATLKHLKYKNTHNLITTFFVSYQKEGFFKETNFGCKFEFWIEKALAKIVIMYSIHAYIVIIM